jgi:hypothetical protein
MADHIARQAAFKNNIDVARETGEGYARVKQLENESPLARAEAAQIEQAVKSQGRINDATFRDTTLDSVAKELGRFGIPLELANNATANALTTEGFLDLSREQQVNAALNNYAENNMRKSWYGNDPKGQVPASAYTFKEPSRGWEGIKRFITPDGANFGDPVFEGPGGEYSLPGINTDGIAALKRAQRDAAAAAQQSQR